MWINPTAAMCWETETARHLESLLRKAINIEGKKPEERIRQLCQCTATSYVLQITKSEIPAKLTNDSTERIIVSNFAQK